MSQRDDERAIRAAAHSLWVREGRPEGKESLAARQVAEQA